MQLSPRSFSLIHDPCTPSAASPCHFQSDLEGGNGQMVPPQLNTSIRRVKENFTTSLKLD